MKRKLFIYPALFLAVVFVISGCSTTPKKQQEEEIKGIKAQVDTLQTRVETVEAKQAEVEQAIAGRSQDELGSEEKSRTNFDIKPRSGKSKERTMEIQAALKNAGFYSGKIDGVSGKGTRRAIKKFQKTNGLTADGVVGKRTWELLSKYAQDSGSSGEVAK